MIEVAAIVTDEGAPTSHAAITARALEIPPSWASTISSITDSGTVVAVDAVHGRLIVHPNEEDFVARRRGASV